MFEDKNIEEKVEEQKPAEEIKPVKAQKETVEEEKSIPCDGCKYNKIGPGRSNSCKSCIHINEVI